MSRLTITPDWSRIPRGADPESERTTLSVMFDVRDLRVLPAECRRCGKASIVAVQLGVAGTDHLLGTLRRCTYCATEPDDDEQEVDDVFGHDDHRHTGDPEDHVPRWARDLYDRVSMFERRMERRMATIEQAMTDLDGYFTEIEGQLADLKSHASNGDTTAVQTVADEIEAKIAAARAVTSGAAADNPSTGTSTTDTGATTDPGVTDVNTGASGATATTPGTDNSTPTADLSGTASSTPTQ